MNICQNLWPQLYRKLPKGFPQDLACILNKHNISPETSFGGHNKKRSKHNKIWYYMAPKRWISIRNIIIYLETNFRPIRRIFVFWRPFLVQNGHHSKPKWSSYGDLFFLHRFLLLLSPQTKWRLIVFAPFLIIIIIMNICQNLWPHL
jgi:hypothetical protein